ncbi:Rodlin protein RdlB [Streptomyces sp. enrichment culture]
MQLPTGVRFSKGKIMKKLWATAAIAASVVGAASPAMAVGNGDGTHSASGNGASQSFGNSATFGDMSPQLSLVQGSLNKPCIGLPAKLNAQGLVGIVAVGVLQDVPILSAPQNQQCVENSTQAKGDEPLSHILDDVALLSGNGEGN